MLVKIVIGAAALWFILALYSCFVMAGRADEEMERQYREKQGGNNG